MRCMGRGKWYWIAGVVVTAMLLFAGTAIGYYDDFESESINPEKWLFQEAYRKVNQDTEVLVQENRAIARNSKNEAVLQNPESIDPFRASVSITAISVKQENVYTQARIEGTYYNVNSEPTSSVGDVWAGLIIGYRSTDGDGDDLIAWCSVARNDSGDWSIVTQEYEIIPVAIQMNAFYQLEIDFDGSHSFTFTITEPDGTQTSTVIEGYNNGGEAFAPYRALSTCAYAEKSDGGTSAITAEFDNVFNGGDLLDDFSTGGLPSGVWQSGEFERKIENGELMLYTRGQGTRVSTRSLLKEKDIDDPEYPIANTDYLEATVRVDSSSWVEGSDGDTTNRARTRIEGRFFNYLKDGSTENPYNGYEGDVWTQVALDRWPNGSMSASCYAETYLDETTDSPKEVFWHPFEMEIEADHNYLLSIRKMDDRMRYQIVDLESDPLNVETYDFVYPEGTTIYEPYDNYRALRTRVYEYGGGGEIKAYFDNVLTQPRGIITGTISGPATGNILVGLFTPDQLDNLENESPVMSTIADADGNYVFYPYPGTWFIAAVQDVNGNGHYDAGIEPMGFYFSDDDGNLNEPAQLVLGSDEYRSEMDFSLYYRPDFLETELERNNFPDDEGTPDWMPKGEVIMAEAEIAYGGSYSNVKVSLTGDNVNDEIDNNGVLLDDGVFPDDIAGDNIYTGYVFTTDDPLGEGPYTFVVDTEDGITTQSSDQTLGGVSIACPVIDIVGRYVAGQPIEFTWAGDPNTGHYSLIILDNVDGEPVPVQLQEFQTGILTSKTIDVDEFTFEIGKDYTWLIIARDDADINVGISKVETFTIPTSVSIANSSETPSVIAAGGSFEFEATGGTGSYTWNVDGPGEFSDEGSGSSFTFIAPDEGAFAGDYTVTVSDGIGEPAIFVVSVPPVIEQAMYNVLEGKISDPLDLLFILKGLASDDSVECTLLDKDGNEIADEMGYGYLSLLSPDPEDPSSIAKFGYTGELVDDDLQREFRVKFSVDNLEPVISDAVTIIPVVDYAVTVVDESGAPVYNITVYALSGDDELSSGDTSVDGIFTFHLPMFGCYEYQTEPDEEGKYFSAIVSSCEQEIEIVLQSKATASVFTILDVTDGVDSIIDDESLSVYALLPPAYDVQYEWDDETHTIAVPPASGYTLIAELDGYETQILTDLTPPAELTITMPAITQTVITSVTAKAYEDEGYVEVTVRANPEFFTDDQLGAIFGDDSIPDDIAYNSDDHTYSFTHAPVDEDFTVRIAANTIEDFAPAEILFSYTAGEEQSQATLDSAGGETELEDNAWVEVPEGAVDQPVTVTLRKVPSDVDAGLGTGGFIYEITAKDASDNPADVNRIIIMLPIDLSIVKPGSLQSGAQKIFYADDDSVFGSANFTTEVPAANILAVDYLGDGKTGSVTFWVDHLTVFGVGSASSISTSGGATSGSSTSASSGGGGGGCFVSQLSNGDLNLRWMGFLILFSAVLVCLKARNLR